MNKLHLIFILLIFIGCQKKNKLELPEKVINIKVQRLDSLKELTAKQLKPLTDIDWVSKYKSYIKEENPKFRLDPNKHLTYWVVPLLSIPSAVLVKDSIDFLRYIENGTLTLDNATCYVIEDSIPIATFIIYDNIVVPFSPTDFNEYIRNRKIDEIRKSKLYFHIGIEEKDGFSFLPGIVFLSKNKFKFLCYDDEKIYPIKEIYRTLYTDEKYLKKMVNRIIDRDKE